MIDKRAVITGLAIFGVTSIFSVGGFFFTRYLDDKMEAIKVQQSKFDNLSNEISSLKKKNQSLKDFIRNNESTRDKLENTFKFEVQNKFNELEKGIEKSHLQFEWLESRYRKADKEIIKRFRRK
jgi:uncharacterized protein YlxW (UPF0749 family)